MNEEDKYNFEEKKNQFFLSKETQNSLKKLIPKISIDEVYIYKFYEAPIKSKILRRFLSHL